MSTATRRTWLVCVWTVAIAFGWTNRADAQFETPNRQFHNETAFPLDGRHRDLPCASCHQQGAYKGTPTKCFDCHWTRRQDDRFRLQLGTQCEQCHRTTTWAAARWDHAAMTGMSLGAAHQQLACQACHVNDNFRSAQANCYACHQKDYQATQTPNHAAAGFPTTCETCHRTSDATFAQARFDHASTFPLFGVHAVQTCATCHTNNLYRGTPRECVGCHKTDYDRTVAPSHAAAGFPTTCENCHRPTDASWSANGGFNHGAVFALVGVHATQACAACHVNNVFRGTPRDCVGCHLADYNRTTSPVHASAGFPTTCDSCHRASDSSWLQGTFNHLFPITSGPHRVSCTICHQGGNYQTFTCLVCHEHDRASMDAHHAGRPGYRYDSLACYGCHPNGRH